MQGDREPNPYAAVKVHDLKAGDRISVRRADTVARFARTAHARPFLELLRQKILKELTR